MLNIIRGLCTKWIIFNFSIWLISKWICIIWQIKHEMLIIPMVIIPDMLNFPRFQHDQVC